MEGVLAVVEAGRVNYRIDFLRAQFASKVDERRLSLGSNTCSTAQNIKAYSTKFDHDEYD